MCREIQPSFPFNAVLLGLPFIQGAIKVCRAADIKMLRSSMPRRRGKGVGGKGPAAQGVSGVSLTLITQRHGAWRTPIDHETMSVKIGGQRVSDRRASTKHLRLAGEGTARLA